MHQLLHLDNALTSITRALAQVKSAAAELEAAAPDSPAAGDVRYCLQNLTAATRALQAYGVPLTTDARRELRAA